MRYWTVAASLAALAMAVSGCATTGQALAANEPVKDKTSEKPAEKPRPLPKGLDSGTQMGAFASTYQPLKSAPTAIVGGTVLTGDGQEIDGGVVLIKDGKIEAVGKAIAVPSGYQVVDAKGRYVTPGIIDIHSHLGVYATPGVQAHSDGNEATSPNTAHVWAEHSVWPQDPGFNAARAGGITTMQILPGSANLFGGRSVTLKNVPSRTVQGMKFPDAPYGLKMACGENPKRVYGSKGAQPQTRMGNMASDRAAWIDAADYARKWDDYHAKVSKGEKADAPKRDLRLETLAGVLRGEILVQNHCYRADEMAQMIDMSKEFGYKITTFHHASEGYKIPDLLKANDICIATWAGWWGFKMESYDGIEENAGIVEANGGCAIIHSDDPILTQRLNQEAAAAWSAANRAGLKINRAQALKWITLNPAKAIGLGDKIGSLAAGKNADVVIWSADPFSIYAKADRVIVDGAAVFDRFDKRLQPKSDFELGQASRESFQ